MTNIKILRYMLPVVAIFLTHGAFAADDDTFSLEELKNLTITSVSKGPERAFEAASAIHVITAEDIRRAGIENVPEALRLVPGLQVSQVDSNKWAITSRGFAGIYANKLLVLIDGRSVYTPEFSGVVWDAQDVVIEDIKRIEVIRGPGAALWGANAVNGVINIITKHASETQGKLVSTTVGTEHIGETAVGRYGGKINDHTYYRAYAKYTNKGDVELANGSDANTEWFQYRTGFRIDSDANGSDNSYTLQGDTYYSDKHRTTQAISLTPTVINHTDDNSGGNILGRWKHKYDNGSESVLQLYFDNARRDHLLFNRSIDTYDADFQHTWDYNDRNRLTWGLGYRFVQTDIIQDSEWFDFGKDNYYDNLYSSFVQDRYEVVRDKVFLTLGSKFEHNDYTGFEAQPSARVSWLPSDNQTVWASVSKAVRTPNIGEHDVSLVVGTSAGTGGLQKGVGNKQFESEELIAYEVGYRVRPKSSLVFDITGFYNDYSNLLAYGKPYVSAPDVIIPINNLGTAETYGLEFSSTWDATQNWRLIANYTFLTMDIHADRTTELDEGKSPKNQVSLRSHYNITPDLEFDNIMYYVDNLSSINIPGYIRFDTRVGWRPSFASGLELSLVGQNLFNDNHQEFSKPSNTPASPPEIGRVVYAKATWKF